MKKASSKTIDRAISEYTAERLRYEAFVIKLEGLLADLFKQERLPVDVLHGRAKSVESLREKISRPGKNYTDPMAEITDLAGVRVVLYHKRDLEKACRIIEYEFKIDRENSTDKSRSLRPQEFGYLSVHYIASLNDSRASLTEWKQYKYMRAEIQVRTVLQHAWASIDHALRYKREADIPEAIRRRLFRLSGLLELVPVPEVRLQRWPESLPTVARAAGTSPAGGPDANVARFTE